MISKIASGDPVSAAFGILSLDASTDETLQLLRGRERVVADFLVGAHAMLHADRLLTRDRGFYRKHFARLEILDPSDEPA